MQPLLLLKQTLEAPYDPGPLLLDGPHVSFTHPEQILTRAGGEVATGFRVEFDAAARGVRVVVETHSRLILRAIQTAVARGRLTPEDVALHWFTRDSETGLTRVDRAELDAKGSFGEWPVDFSESEVAADDEWLDAVYGEPDA